MLDEVKRIVELTAVDDIDFITLMEEEEGLRCIFFSGAGGYSTFLVRKGPLMRELKSHAIANIIYGMQATKLRRRLCSWI